MSRRSTSRLHLIEARYPVRVRILVPPFGFGTRTDLMEAWLREHVGREGYATHGASRFGQDAMHVYFDGPHRASDFVKRFDLKLARGLIVR